MSELRQVDRVMLEKIRRIELLLSGMYGTGEQWRAEAECTRALLTEQTEPEQQAGEQIEPDMLHITLCDALAGWQYIRANHGDLYGVGWDRVEQRLQAQISESAARLKRTATEPDAPQEAEDCHDPKHTINNYRGTPCPFCQRDQYKEKLDTLQAECDGWRRLVGEYHRLWHEWGDAPNVITNVQLTQTRKALFAYAEEVGGAE